MNNDKMLKLTGELLLISGIFIGAIGAFFSIIKMSMGNADNTDSLSFYIAMVIMGVIFLAMGLELYFKGVKTGKKMDDLLNNGRVVNCVITDIITASDARYEYGKKIKCRNNDPDSKNETYISMKVYLEDSKLPKIGDTVPVYVDRNDSRIYYVAVGEEK